MAALNASPFRVLVERPSPPARAAGTARKSKETKPPTFGWLGGIARGASFFTGGGMERYAPPRPLVRSGGRTPGTLVGGGRIRPSTGGTGTRAAGAVLPLAPLPTGSVAKPGDGQAPVTGPRRTADATDGAFTTSVGAVLPPENPEDTWRVYSLDENALRSISPARLMAILADLSPDVSRALYDFLRMCNPGYELLAYKAGGKEVDAAAQANLDAMLAKLQLYYGTVDVVFNRMFAGAWLRGAFFGELVLDGDYGFADLAIADPIVARFRRQSHPTRGRVWELGQYQPYSGSGSPSPSGFVSLDFPNVSYIPVDPFPGLPYGRPLCSAGLFTSLFLLGLLHDLRRVVAQQGYPRLDVEINMEQLRLTMPPDDVDDPDKLKEWVTTSIQAVQAAMASLKPSDTYVHTDVVKLNRPVGTVDSTHLGGLDGLIRALERMATRALKTMPLSMASTEGMSEANANRQWELQAKGVKAIQHAGENMLSKLFGLGLQMAGTPAIVVARFAELRAAEELRDQQTLTLKVKNWTSIRDAGFASQDEASMMVTGHPADSPEPRPWATANGDLLAQDSNSGAEQDSMSKDPEKE